MRDDRFVLGGLRDGRLSCGAMPCGGGREARSRQMTRIAIEHGLVLTMDRENRVIEDGRVVVEGRDIVAVDQSDGVPLPDCDVVIDAAGKIVLPGLVNAHTHLCMVYGRTIGP